MNQQPTTDGPLWPRPKRPTPEELAAPRKAIFSMHRDTLGGHSDIPEAISTEQAQRKLTAATGSVFDMDELVFAAGNLCADLQEKDDAAFELTLGVIRAEFLDRHSAMNMDAVRVMIQWLCPDQLARFDRLQP